MHRAAKIKFLGARATECLELFLALSELIIQCDKQDTKKGGLLKRFAKLSTGTMFGKANVWSFLV